MTALTMFLPHIPVSMSHHLPSLFIIYTRILYWEKVRIKSGQTNGMDSEKRYGIGMYFAILP